jgi:regulatory protein
MKVESLRTGASGTAVIAAGGFTFSARIETLKELGFVPETLEQGAELDEAAAASLALAAEAYGAEKRALSLVARAEQSEAMLAIKLEQRGFSRKAASLALGRLREAGLVNDRRYAEAYILSRLSRRPEGASRLLAAIRSRGIDDETARAALAAVFGTEERRSALARAAEREIRRAGSRGLEDSELGPRMRALGFGGEDIRLYFESRGSPEEG